MTSDAIEYSIEIHIPLTCSILKSGPKNRLPTTAGGVAVDIALFGG